MGWLWHRWNWIITKLHLKKSVSVSVKMPALGGGGKTKN